MLRPKHSGEFADVDFEEIRLQRWPMIFVDEALQMAPAKVRQERASSAADAILWRAIRVRRD
jgi:hypothetical protein